jgi:hypothetical protein
VSSISIRTRTPRAAARSIALISSCPLSSSLKMKYWMSSVFCAASAICTRSASASVPLANRRKAESPGCAFARASASRPIAVLPGRSSANDSLFG